MNKIESIFRHRKVTAVLDSCVLFPAQLRDIFMHLALKGVFRPRWSDEIHNEWIRAVLQNRSDLTTAKFIDAMEEQIKMLKNPPISKKEFVKILQNSKLPQTATRLNQKKF